MYSYDLKMLLDMDFLQMKKLKFSLIKYLTTNQSILNIEIHNSQIHQHNQFVDCNIQNHQWNV